MSRAGDVPEDSKVDASMRSVMQPKAAGRPTQAPSPAAQTPSPAVQARATRNDAADGAVGGGFGGETAAKSAAAAPKGTRAGVGGWLSKAAAKVPTSWLGMAAIGVFLAATAAFGGLETAEASEPSALVAGETHAGGAFSLAIQRAVLIDEFAPGGAFAEDGERVLVLIVDAENLWTNPIGTLQPVMSETVRLESLPDVPMESAARVDDATLGPTLQPGVPAQLALSWVVPADALAEGDTLAVGLFDHTLRVGESVIFGEYWSDPELAAVVNVEVEDVGAGTNAEDGS